MTLQIFYGCSSAQCLPSPCSGDKPMTSKLRDDLAEVVSVLGVMTMRLESHFKAMRFIRTHHAEIQRNAEDAARYRWLCDKQATIIYKRVGFGEWEPLIDTVGTSTRSASLDTAIDAAMRANGGENPKCS